MSDVERLLETLRKRNGILFLGNNYYNARAIYAAEEAERQGLVTIKVAVNYDQQCSSLIVKAC